MKILLVEDDRFKQDLIEGLIRSIKTDQKPIVHNTRSVQQSVSALNKHQFDLVILDIALPSHDSKPGGAQPLSQPSGGIEVLLEISYQERFEKVLILTQYPEIEFEERSYPLAGVRKAFGNIFSVKILDAVFFDPASENWKTSLVRAIQ